MTSDIAKKVEATLKGEKDIDSFTTTVGSLSALGNKAVGGSSGGDQYANITVNLVKKEYGRERNQVIADRVRKRTNAIIIPGVTITVQSLKSGPPAGADLEVRVAGKDFNVLDKLAKEVKPIVQ